MENPQQTAHSKHEAALRAIYKYLSSPGLSAIDDKIREIIDTALQGGGMNVLSLFDGMSCGRVALERTGIVVTSYHACEIDKHAIAISKKNYPDIIQHGSVVGYTPDYPVDLLIGGSPCQGFSFAGKQLAFDDPRSKLFFEYVRILKVCQERNPNVKFLLENVNMKKEYLKVINDLLGVKGIKINSNLVSAQNRNRWYWTNIAGVEQPQDRGLVLRDILEDEVDSVFFYSEGQLNRLKTSTDIAKGFSKIDPKKAGCMTARQYANWKGTFISSYFAENLDQLTDNIKRAHPRVAAISISEKGYRPYKPDGRSGSLSELGRVSFADQKAQCVVSAHAPKLATAHDLFYRRLTPVECERLQTLPDNYTAGVSNSQRYKMIGNGWTVDVIAHIFNGLS